MSHCVSAFVVHSEHASEVQASLEGTCCVLLNQGLALFPATDALLDQLGSFAGECNEFSSLTSDLQRALLKCSAAFPVLYFETDYFGGAGSQIAVVFHRGKAIFGPKERSSDGASGKTPISEGLEVLGVRPVSGLDAFDTVGLGRFRRTEDWIP